MCLLATHLVGFLPHILYRCWGASHHTTPVQRPSRRTAGILPASARAFGGGFLAISWRHAGSSAERLRHYTAPVDFDFIPRIGNNVGVERRVALARIARAMLPFVKKYMARSLSSCAALLLVAAIPVHSQIMIPGGGYPG